MTTEETPVAAADEAVAAVPVAAAAVTPAVKDAFADFDGAQASDALEVLLKAGVHFGHQKSRRHPRMQPYIFDVRNTVTIIDLEKTQAAIRAAQAFLVEVRRSGKPILFSTTKRQMTDLVKSAAVRGGEPYVVERWIGGTFTNLPVIRRRVKQLLKMEEDQAKGVFRKYTKLEQLRKQEEIEKLNRTMGGLKTMEDLPGALVVVDLKMDALAVREARAKGVPIVAITDTNVDPSDIDYAIPANDDAISSVRTILGLLLAPVLAVTPIAPVRKAPAVAPAVEA